MYFRYILVFSLLLAVFSERGNAQITLPAIIGDHMVLQQQSNVPLWGWAQPGQTVRVTGSWDNQNMSTKTDGSGRWELKIKTPDAGGPYTVEIQANEKITLQNVMIGEVWLCSGQSNMEMPLKGWPNEPIAGSEGAIERANYPEIRLFTVERKTAFEPQKDCHGVWQSCSPETAGDFSATGFFFGQDLYKKLKVPIGLIHSSWGGTPAEAWTSQSFINQIPYFHTSTGNCDPVEFRNRKLKEYESIQTAWLQNLGVSKPERSPDWSLPDYNDESWNEVQVPASWNEAEIGHYEGLVELRYEFRIPMGWTKRDMILELGPIDEMDNTWVNGVLVGSHLNVYDWAAVRSYTLPAGTLKKGKNVIAVQVVNTSGLGGINGEKSMLKLHPAGKKIFSKSIAGKWTYRKVKAFNQVEPMPWCNNCGVPQSPTTLYNGMIAPLIPYRIKGAIWYQGESNRYDGPLYEDIFGTMIENWRHDWGQGSFPFYFVQIAPYTYRDAFDTGLLREAQANSLKLKNTGMVVTMDIGSLQSIHPPDKKSVGIRLSAWALAKDYSFSNLYYSGPLYKSFTIEDGQIRVQFNYTCGGLKSDGGPLRHFLIAGADRKFVPASAKIVKNELIVFSKEVRNPVAVRFGWGNTDQTNLFNLAGLPAGPFRTDDW